MPINDNETRKITVHTVAGAPNANEDVSEGFLCGDLWIDKTDATSTNWTTYILVDCTEGAAVWKQITN